MMNDWGWGGWLFGGLAMAMIAAALIPVVVVVLVRTVDHQPNRARAEEVLATRFANGEIDESDSRTGSACCSTSPARRSGVCRQGIDDAPGPLENRQRPSAPPPSRRVKCTRGVDFARRKGQEGGGRAFSAIYSERWLT